MSHPATKPTEPVALSWRIKERPGLTTVENFVRNLPDVKDLIFTHCSPAIVTQLNMICNFRGPARVRSFLAPYVCERCSHEEEKLLDVESHFPNRDFRKVPKFPCERCGAELEFDDLPERYLSFLVEP